MSRARLDAWRDRRTTPLGFTLDGVRYEIPAHPARVWVLALLSDEPADLLLDVIGEDDADQLWEDATDPDCDLTLTLLTSIGRAVLTRAAGRPWWQAAKLVASMVTEWDVFIGTARDRGLGDPLEWPIDELCAWVYLRLIKGADGDERGRIEDELQTPPAEVLDDPDADPDTFDEASSWLAAASQAPPPAPA